MRSIFTFIVLTSYLSPCLYAKEGPAEKVGKSIDKNVESASHYTKEQKEKIINEFNTQLKSLDSEIEKLKAKTTSVAKSAKTEGSKQIEDQIIFLENRKKAIQSEIAQLTSASGKAWDQIKIGIEESFTSLKKSFKKAKDEFTSDSK